MTTPDDLVARLGNDADDFAQGPYLYSPLLLTRNLIREAADRIAELQDENAKLRAVVEAAKAMRRYPMYENSYGKDFDAAIAALEK